nr:tubulin glycylase [Tanacetum cinerariifolium]
MSTNEELKIDVEQAKVTSPRASGGLARQGSVTKNNCLCSPTTHAGSFRCRLHRSPSGIQRTKSINSDSNENDVMKTVMAP